MAKKVVLVGDGEARDLLRQITRALRARGIQSSAYLDAQTPFAYHDLDGAEMFVIGLSRAGRQINSDAHTREKTLLAVISKMPHPVPCVVISDIDDNVSAPYLSTYHGLVCIVGSNNPEKVAQLELFGKHRVVPRDSDSIVCAIYEEMSVPVRATA